MYILGKQILTVICIFFIIRICFREFKGLNYIYEDILFYCGKEYFISSMFVALYVILSLVTLYIPLYNFIPHIESHFDIFLLK